ncbi:MAG: pre-peptidase C-terminal domain-containing protein [Myxococcota bacterium]
MRNIQSISLLKALFTIAFISFSFEAQAITRESEPNNRQSSADGPLISGTSVSGSIDSNNDEDWFKFSVDAAGPVTISVRHHRRDDFDWYLYAEAGDAVARGSSPANPEVGTFNATQTGVYYLRVARYSGRGWYDLNVRFPGSASTKRPPKPANIKSYVTGDPQDARVRPVDGPGVLLMGGGTDVDAAFINRVFPIANGGDVVVIRTNDSDGYNDYLFNLVSGSLRPDSIETIVIDTVAKANTPFTQWVLSNAEAVFIAGGDQSAYLNAWKGTAVERAIQSVYDKGGVVGGTSAGCAIQGEHIYDPDGVLGAITEEVVVDPYDETVNLSPRIFNFPIMDRILTDTHFYERDRMGRLMVFMGRLHEDGAARSLFGVGVSEQTSLFIDRRGVGIVDGNYEVYVLREGSRTRRRQIAPGQPAIYEDVTRYRLVSGDTFDFDTERTSVSPIDISIDGNFPRDPYSPQNPY